MELQNKYKYVLIKWTNPNEMFIKQSKAAQNDRSIESNGIQHKTGA